MNTTWGRNEIDDMSPAIMQSLDSLSLYNKDMHNTNHSLITVNSNTGMEGLSAKNKPNNIESFLLIDKYEKLKVLSAEQFIRKLNCIGKDRRVKVVSIFGNTGDGKSHTLNQTFFKGREVFKTSNDQTSCTFGIWAAFDPNLNVICLDTEGLLGVTVCESGKIRLLLKVLAISDIVIYRTRSEKLNKDLFLFLSSASQAYSHYFRTALQAMGERAGMSSSLTSLGPCVIVLQETRHTKPLSNNGSETAEDMLRTRFGQMRLEIESFSKLKYVGLQTLNSSTNYEPLRVVINNELENTSVRFARHPQLVYSTLKHLNDKFSAENTNLSNIIFSDQYFSCPVKCLSCGCRCSNSMGHLRDGKPHSNTNTRCRYQNQYENLIYICKRCYSNGKEVKVTTRLQTHNDKSWYGLAVYAWYGSIIECPHCGEIYRSRQYWYGNKDPEEVAVCTEITHVWFMPTASNVPQNTAQRMVDGVSYITEAVTNVSLQPTKAISAWVTDQIAPSYWRPNNEIKWCFKCKTTFGVTDTKHHCRACGEGFCAQCSSQTKCVPSRNWYTPVRVCDTCYMKDTNNYEAAQTADDVNARKVTEQVVSTLSAVGTVLNYSKTFIKDTVRPSYWVPDSEITGCCICNQKFSLTLSLHHCRDCGRGVCEECSPHRKPVLHRGWDKPVRVCNACIKID
ncbi:PREDICTED: zinc finger FYVE domain-containing protein 1-like isoform X2 [Polistes canadensis]|uniref:zinc finger FYVE domain-containing protein 1-like isoform X2 n=1 Tax=Polistes canadensis TaxID=91411 RepID=UPI000718F601|nr:PREDICTED: zinc finger FYVE domain-containing protein 1-like isoform X2 [Polistes canadensis]